MAGRGLLRPRRGEPEDDAKPADGCGDSCGTPGVADEVTAASPTPAPVGDDAPAPPRLPAWLVPAGLTLAITGLHDGLLLGRGMADDGVRRVTDSVSLGFVRDMGVHHAQAGRMSEIARRRSADPTLNYLAFDILSTQQGEIGTMSGWLELLRQSRSGTAAPMAWMGHTGPMPGMATDAELDTLPSRRWRSSFSG